MPSRAITRPPPLRYKGQYDGKRPLQLYYARPCDTKAQTDREPPRERISTDVLDISKLETRDIFAYPIKVENLIDIVLHILRPWPTFRCIAYPSSQTDSRARSRCTCTLFTGLPPSNCIVSLSPLFLQAERERERKSPLSAFLSTTTSSGVRTLGRPSGPVNRKYLMK